MAKIEEFEFKNVRSYGNKMTKIPFNTENGLTLIQGKNGHGKTSICEALEYAIYGKSSREQSKNLPNWVNDNMYTSIKFKTDDNRTVSLSRGIAPDFFQIDIEGGQSLSSKDKKSENVATKPRLDKMVENELFGIPFEVFSNNILLSIDDFKSFINMKISDKRKIIDKIFETDIFNDMLVKLKAELKELKEQQMVKTSTLSVKEDLLKSTLARVEDIKLTIDDSREQVIETYKTKISQLEKEIGECILLKDKNQSELQEKNKKHNEYLALVKEVTDKINREYNNLLVKITTKYNNIFNEKQTADTNKMNEELQSLQSDINSRKVAIIPVERRIGTITDDLNSKINVLETEMNDSINHINSQRDSVKKNMEDKINSEKEAVDVKYNEDIKSLTDSKSSLVNTINNLQTIVNNITTELNDIRVEQKTTENKMSLYNNHKCPQCGIDLEHTEFHVQKKNELEKELNAINDKISQKQFDLSNTNSELERNKQEYENCINKINEITTEYNNAVLNFKSRLEKGFSNLENLISENINKVKNSKEVEIARLKQQKDDVIKNAQNEYNSEINDIQSDYINERNRITEKYDPIFRKNESEKNTNINSESLVSKSNYDAEMASLTREYNTSIETFNKEIKTLTDSNNELSSKLDSLQSNKNELFIELTKIESSDNIKLLSELTTMADGLESEVKEINTDLEKINEEIWVRENTEFLIGDNGLKRVIMRNILPSFNQTINEITTLFNFKYRFMFDDNFDAHLFVFGKEVPISTSKGEEKIMDIIVLLATLQLILMKHPSINMLFLDEIFSNLDVENIALATGILRDYSKKYNLNIFVMSHTTVPQELFDQIIQVTSDGMFSELQIIK